MKKLIYSTRTCILFLLFLTAVWTSAFAQDGWERMTDMPTSRGIFKTVMHNGKIYAIGGIKSSSPPYVKCNEVYDIEKGEWSELKSMDEPRSGLTVEILNNKIYVIGGVYSTSQQYSDILEYDIETDTWVTKCTMPEPRFNHISEVLNGKIYIAGGLSVDANGKHPGLTSSRIYDPASDHWDTIANLNKERFMARSCIFDNKIYVFGGAPSGVPYKTAHRSLEIYDPETDVWSISEDEIPIPFMGGMVLAYGDTILLLGGFEVVLNEECYNSIYKYVPCSQSNKWIEMAPMLADRGLMSGNITGHYLHMIGGMESVRNWDLVLSPDNHWRLDLDSLKPFVTGLEGSAKQEISIFPNPTNDLIIIQIPGHYTSTVEIIEVSGLIVRKFVTTERFIQVDLSAYPSGTYLIKVISGNHVNMGSVMKI